MAVEVYQHRRDKGGPGDSASDWKQAQVGAAWQYRVGPGSREWGLAVTDGAWQ